MKLREQVEKWRSMEWKHDREELCWYDVVNSIAYLGSALVAVIMLALSLLPWPNIINFNPFGWIPVVVFAFQQIRLWIQRQRQFDQDTEMFEKGSHR